MLHEWDWNSQMKYLEQKGRDNAYRAQVRENLHPQAGEIVGHLIQDFPWMSPGAVASLAQMGLGSDSPEVTALARLEFQRRVAKNDWGEIGDVIRPQHEPVEAPPDLSAIPFLPPVAPSDGSPAQAAAMSNPIPETTPPVTPPPVDTTPKPRPDQLPQPDTGPPPEMPNA